MKLYINKDTVSCLKIELAGSFANQNITVMDGAADPSMLQHPHNVINDAFLETSKGIIYGGDAIFRFIGKMWPEFNLYGDNLYKAAEIDMWINFAMELESNLFPQTMLESNKQAVKKSIDALENYLMDVTYLVSHNITLADIAVGATLYQAKIVSSFEDSSFVNTKRWLETISKQKAFVKVISKNESSKKPKETPHKGAQKDTPSKSSKDTPEQEPAQQNEEKEEDVGALNLSIINQWKKIYSNSKNKAEEAMPWFWNQKEIEQNYSIWLMKYEKLPTEGKFDFITSNMLAGFMQRIDNKMRDDNFGMIYVIGENKNFDIQGVWLFSGSEIPEIMKEHPSYEYNIFTKLNWNNPDDQKIVTEYWCNTETIEGRPIIVIQPWK